ncbi:thiamine phosphate synthase [Legionella fallonii]|uniref:Thiamine-phosphate synthase n=1 Tax=Legionella fallonii LLAP-10 TaxID=1212491 RepID=A0A098G4F8_9GAMM|nr:thiamine phosphate synthase [Legionella fallonii]CEG56874.1 Thiamine-phosphate pyrophosphorylase [Legionella fallonii LLAP-10]
MKKPIVWTIASVDPAGLSGVQVDLETLKNFNVDSCFAAIEAISSDQVAAQYDALQYAFKPDTIKIGMIGTSSTHEKITHFLKDYPGFVVLDPILALSSRTPLIFSNVQQHIERLVKLFPYVDIVTPNLIEAEKILNRSLTSYQDIQEGAHAMLALGAKSVLLKGGHVKDALFSQDYWTNGHESFWLANQRLPNRNYRGVGCTLSSALAACLALGHSIKDAIVIAKMYVTRGIRKALNIDQHTAKLFHGGWPEDEIDLPYLSPTPLLKLPAPFKQCQIGLYPVVDSSHWLEKLLPEGVKCIQLRIKNMRQARLEEEIKRSIFLAKKYCVTLFINDYWELAIRFGAQGIHLGQEDLHEADIDKIRQSGLHLGVSTHCYYEVATAHALNPSYIACGPIYPTTSKVMSFQPQGIDQLQRWRRTLHYPLVAIGGMTFERLPEILKARVDGVSLISAITKADNPLTATQQFLTQMKELRDG